MPLPRSAPPALFLLLIAGVPLLPAQPGRVFPQLADGGGIRSEVLLTNPGDTAQAGTLRFRQPSGEPWPLGIATAGSGELRYRVEPGGVARFTTDGSGPARSGYLVVEPDDPDSRVTASIGYQLGEFEVSAAATAPADRFHTFVEVGRDVNTGIAVVNLQGETAPLWLRLFDPDGTARASRVLELGGGRQMALFVDELFIGLGDFTGSLHLSGPVPFATLGLRQRASGALSTLPGAPDAFDGAVTTFGTVTVRPLLELEGAGSNIDSLAFWENPDPGQVLLLVTGKANRVVEVWRFPFAGNEQPPIQGVFGEGDVNGVVVDQLQGLLYVTQSAPSSRIYVFSLPDLTLVQEFGDVDLGREPNLDLQDSPDGSRRLFVTSDAGNVVHVFDLQGAAGPRIDEFDPEGPGEIETILVDDLHQILYVPDEESREGVYAFHTDGTPYLNCSRGPVCTHRFAVGLFQADAEGILLYRCPASGPDSGNGFIVVSDQRQDVNEYEFFDRVSWRHLGTLQLEGVDNTDGIASTQQPLPGFPLGLFAAVHDDRSVQLVGWDVILEATGLACSAP